MSEDRLIGLIGFVVVLACAALFALGLALGLVLGQHVAVSSICAQLGHGGSATTVDDGRWACQSSSAIVIEAR